MEFEPPDTGAGGSRVSPVSTSMRATGKPSASAAVTAITVRTPLPISCVALCTRTEPSGVSRTRTAAGATWLGYMVAAVPHPTSQSPSRMDRGVAWRRDQPKALDAASKHSRRWRLL